jgi:putative endonuclease
MDTARYGLGRLVWYERFPDIRNAIQRERNMKHWPRAWKVHLILDQNPDWHDLHDDLNAWSLAAPRGWPGQARP